MANIVSVENTVIDLAKAIKAISFYPSGHPTLSKVLSKIAADIATFCEDGKLTIEATKEAFIVKNNRISSANPVLRDFLQTLFLRRVNRIIFSCQVSGEELYEFLNLLTMDMNNIFQAGGLENIMEASSIKNIALSEKQFIRHKEQANSNASQHSTHNSDSQNQFFDVNSINLNVVDLQNSQNLNSIQPLQKTEETKEELWQRIKAALENARDTNNVGIYIENIKDVDAIVSQLVEIDNFIIDVFYYFSLDALNEKLIDDIRKEAQSFLRNSFGNERIKKLIDYSILNYDKPEIGNKVHKIYEVLGDRAVDGMIDKLSSSNNIKERRYIINEIINLGTPAFERVIYYLEDDRWFVIRNMLTILGFAREEKYLPFIYKLIDYPDVRVRKELVKTLSRIPGKQSLKHLREMLKKEIDEIKQLVIFSLGILKDQEAVDDIISELKNNENVFIKKEALLALGRIGNNRALQNLKEYALKKTFFNKANNKILRLSAIEGLAEIKNAESEKILESLIKDSDIEIREKAFDSLQKIRI